MLGSLLAHRGRLRRRTGVAVIATALSIATAGLGTAWSDASMAAKPPFAHPGALMSASEFQRVAAAVKQGRQPFALDFAKMRSNPHDSPD
jgi:hypothetical protein